MTTGKPRPVLKAGEVLGYEIDIMLKFKDRCVDEPHGRVVKANMAEALNAMASPAAPPPSSQYNGPQLPSWERPDAALPRNYGYQPAMGMAAGRGGPPMTMGARNMGGPPPFQGGGPPIYDRRGQLLKLLADARVMDVIVAQLELDADKLGGDAVSWLMDADTQPGVIARAFKGLEERLTATIVNSAVQRRRGLATSSAFHAAAGLGADGRPRLGGWGQGQGPMLTGPPGVPAKPLERSAQAYRGKGERETLSHFDTVIKEGRSILNKLTMTKFDKLSNDFAQLEILEAKELVGLVNIIFDKALEEGHFCKMYAQLCAVIHPKMPEFTEEGTLCTFKRCLLKKCQEEFERADRYEEVKQQAHAGMDAAGKDTQDRLVRVRMLGNIVFIGELFAAGILNEKIMHECVKRLIASKEEDTIECLSKLMSTIGKRLDREEARHYMDYYFDTMKQTANEILKNPSLYPSGTRLAFLLENIIELRKNTWVPRREEAGPKTILQIRMQAAKEGLL